MRGDPTMLTQVKARPRTRVRRQILRLEGLQIRALIGKGGETIRARHCRSPLAWRRRGTLPRGRRP